MRAARGYVFRGWKCTPSAAPRRLSSAWGVTDGKNGLWKTFAATLCRDRIYFTTLHAVAALRNTVKSNIGNRIAHLRPAVSHELNRKNTDELCPFARAHALLHP